MAKKYESDVDPDAFIRSFREESSSLSSLKQKPAETIGGEAPKSIAAPATDAPTEVSDRESEYLRLFVSNTAYMRHRDRFLMVEIHPEFVRNIKRIIAYEGDEFCSIKSYVNNVLAQHFKEYSEIITPKL